VAQDRDKCLAVVVTVMNIWVSQCADNFLSNSEDLLAAVI
jgi:hypothetical protein